MKEIITWAVDIANKADCRMLTIYYMRGTSLWTSKVKVVKESKGDLPDICPNYASFIYDDEFQVGEPYLVKIKHIPESFEFEKL